MSQSIQENDKDQIIKQKDELINKLSLEIEDLKQQIKKPIETADIENEVYRSECYAHLKPIMDYVNWPRRKVYELERKYDYDYFDSCLEKFIQSCKEKLLNSEEHIQYGKWRFRQAENINNYINN